VLAVISANILVFSITAFFVPSGVAYQGLMAGLPAEQANLEGTIVGVENYTIESLGDLSSALDGIGPGKGITIRTRVDTGDGFDERVFSLTTVEEPNATDSDKGFIGILGVSQDFGLRDGVTFPGLVYFFTGRSPDFFGLLFFLFLINLGVGAFNLLPLGPLDGGRMWRIVLDRFIPRHSKRIMNSLSWVLLLVLLLNFALALT
jgi:membrane-associated protease RseP (regulator of RpoE activity)